MKHLLLAILCAAAISGCTHSIDTVNLGIDDVYYIYRMQKLPLHSALTGEHYRWSVDGRDCGTDAPDYIFLAAEEGTYSLSFDIIDAATPYHFDFTVHVLHEEVEYSPYIARVYEYRPAPGQFVNEMPKYEPGDTEADMVRKAQDCISGTNDVMISLGAYGGYVTFGFDHTVVNIPGEYDFRIWGNAFYELINPELKGGSCEPGIVWDSYDTNCNGLPDDTWYELAGSDYGNPATRHAYTLTYSAPDPDREPVKNGSFIDDAAYIAWTDSDGASGFVPHNIFHKQSYWPMWLHDRTYSLSGSCLPPNAIDTSGNGTYFVLYSFAWGYVDNHPNDNDELNSFKIDWAVDADGMPVALPGIDFVRVQTGINQYCGWIGETSTELSKAVDLHIPILPDLPPEPI